jgi:predicted O-linked N-acetylglucosamine transferase (SPINDLY family)
VLKQALSLHQAGRLDEAASLCRRILAKEPKNADALHLLGVIESQKRNLSVAIEWIDRAIQIQPGNALFLHNHGLALQKLRRFDEALLDFDRAVRRKPDFAEAYCSRGDILFELQRFDEAVASYDRALTIRPRYPSALNNRGFALQKLKRPEEALASYDQALELKGDYVSALNNRGNALQDLKRFEEALESYDRVLKIKPDYAEALSNRGNALRALNRYSEAVACYERALAIKPAYVRALNGRGLALAKLNRLDEAIASYDQALAISPDNVDALSSRGDVLYDLKRFEDALVSYDRAVRIAPDHPLLFGRWLFCRQRICSWDGLAGNFRELAARIDRGEKASPMFALLASPLSAVQLRSAAEAHIREMHPESSLLPKISQRVQSDRIRLGYFSSDFRNHPVAHLSAELFELHDRGRFEVIALSLGPRRRDAMRARLEKAFDRFVETSSLSDRDVALMARSFEIDIAVDLNGFTTDARTGIFAMRAAPIQVSYLGYPGTMGASYIDYLVADATLIPEGEQQHYSEKIVFLPDTFQVNDSKRPIGEPTPSKAECGLPEQGFVFCSFNNNYKFTPDVFDVWMRLLKQIEGSVLWLFEDNAAAARHLRAEAQARGVAASRLVFATKIDLPDHLARHRLADLFLDTLPLNAGTTASDALWAGLPVLTCLGSTFQGRVAASLLKAVGLPELIAEDLQAYETLALRLARAPEQLFLLRQRLAANRLRYPLFDTRRFAKHLESAYLKMWQRHQAGLAPDHIGVQA